MTSLPSTRLRLYVALVVALGLASLWFPPTWSADTADWLLALVAFTVLSVSLEFVVVPHPGGGSFSMASISHVATILLVPPPLAALSIGASVLIEAVARRAPVMKTLFNVGGMLLTASIASAAVGLFGSAWQATPPEAAGPALIVTFALVALSYFGANAVLLSVVLALAEDRSVLSVFRRGAGGTLLGELATTAVGAPLALLWVIEPILTLVLVAPAAVIARSFDHIRRLNTETRTAVRSLAEIVDHRDPTTYHHSERVARNGTRLARALGLPDAEVELIEQAASVHDLGKIGVPDRVLLKPGRLSQAESELMWAHTVLGPEILTRFELFRPGAQIVRHHHERWDGGGYPDGLAGEAIPFGARVVAVVDAFDAMTSNRPYRAALTRAQALRRIADGAGSQWDPSIVNVFLRLMADSAPTETVEVPAARAATTTRRASVGRRVARTRDVRGEA